jgi:Transposase DDE domain group 1
VCFFKRCRAWGTDGSNPVCSSGESRKLDHRDPRMTATRLSCRTFAANAVRLQLHALAYNLGNFMRTLAMPKTAQPWSLTSLRELRDESTGPDFWNSSLTICAAWRETMSFTRARSSRRTTRCMTEIS